MLGQLHKSREMDLLCGFVGYLMHANQQHKAVLTAT